MAAEPVDEHTARVLAERARELAQPPPPPRPPSVELLGFTRAGLRFAVPTAAVAEVLAMGPLTRLPAAPHALVGMRAVRGEVVAVADPSRLLDAPQAGPAPAEAAVVVLADPVAPLALLADTVDRVVTVERPPGEPQQPLVAGLTADGVPVLDVAAVLADPRTSTRPPTTPDRQEAAP